MGVEEAVRLDLFYIENWSLSLDLYILLKSIGVILTRKGAGNSAARSYLEFISSPAARGIFDRFGFRLPREQK